MSTIWISTIDKKKITVVSDGIIQIHPNKKWYLMPKISFFDMINIMLVLYTIIGIVLGVFIILRIILVRKGGHSFPWLQFYIRGKEAGFRLGEINNLQRLVMTNKLRDPLSVYWSQKAALSCVKYMDSQYTEEGTLESTHQARFMRKLYDLLNRVTRSSQEKKRGIQSTREIDAEMPLDVSYHKKQHKSKVIEVQSRYIAIAHPRMLGSKEQVKFVSGEPVVVQFWKRGDSGYNFLSRISDVYDDTGIIHIQHTRKVNRAQARSLTRKDINKTGSLFLLTDVQNALDDEEKGEEGLRCQILDISEGGMSVLIGGKVSDQFGFKVKVRVGPLIVVMVTRLVHSDYHQGKDVSLIRLKGINRSLVMRNRISAVVYGVGLNKEETTDERA